MTDFVNESSILHPPGGSSAMVVPRGGFGTMKSDGRRPVNFHSQSKGAKTAVGANEERLVMTLVGKLESNFGQQPCLDLGQRARAAEAAGPDMAPSAKLLRQDPDVDDGL